MKRLIQLLALGVFFYWTPKFIHAKTDGFILANIYSHYPPDPRFKVEGLPEKTALESALNGPYSYLGSGGQCYAFISSDGKTVLKLFKHHLRRIHPLLNILPLPEKYAQKRKAHRARRIKKWTRDFTSYKLAFEHLKDFTGLFYVQLYKELQEPLPVQLIDKLGIAHWINLSNVEFVLQKHAVLAYDYLDACMARGDLEAARRGLFAICALIAARREKSIYDEDAKIHRNFGFVGEEAIVIDIGRFKKDPQGFSQASCYQELQKTTRKMRDWLSRVHPLLVPTLDMALERYDQKNLL